MRDRERLVADLQYIAHPPTDHPDVELLAVLQRLDEVARDPEENLPPRLKHYLENRSYAKALACLEALENCPDSPDDEDDEPGAPL